MQERILVIAAHPDDEVLGCGGTIARSIDAGHEVHILILGEGITSRYDARAEAPADELEALQKCSQNAAAKLGCHNWTHCSFPDNRFDTVPLIEIVKCIENFALKIRPTIVYTQHGGDLNVDHAVTFRATLTAFRPMSGGSVRSLRAYEVGSSTEYAFKQFMPQFNPNLFVDISGFLEQKTAAMAEYHSEACDFPHPRSSQALVASAQRWGANVGSHAVEPFQIIWQLES